MPGRRSSGGSPAPGPRRPRCRRPGGRGLQHPGGQRVEGDQHPRPDPVGQCGRRGHVLDHPEEVGLGEQHRRGLVAGPAADLLQVGLAVEGPDLDQLEVQPLAVGLQQLPHPRGHGGAHQQLAAPGGGHGHGRGLGHRRRAVVQRGVGDLQAGQLADQRLVLEQGLEHALAHLGLVGGVGGGELPGRPGTRRRRARSGRRRRRRGSRSARPGAGSWRPAGPARPPPPARRGAGAGRGRPGRAGRTGWAGTAGRRRRGRGRPASGRRPHWCGAGSSTAPPDAPHPAPRHLPGASPVGST